MDPLIIVGDQALTEAEYARYRAQQDRINAHRRARRAADPEYRERYNAYMSEWRARNRDHYNAYKREWKRRRRAMGLAA